MQHITYPQPYVTQDGYLCKKTEVAGREVIKRLCNFAPYIKEELLLDNGAEQIRYLKIGGVRPTGETLPDLTISIAEFSAMNWITERWGTSCNLEAGHSIKEHLRHAIQTTGAVVTPKNLYQHLGWRYEHGSWQYLTANSENCFATDPTLLKYDLPTEWMPTDARASLNLLHSGVAPESVVFSMIGFMFTAPLMEFFKQGGFEIKTILALIGPTGSKKSTLAALFLSHFGDFTHDSLPLTFRDTANSILERLYLLKDVPTVIDDFHPSTRNEEIDMTKTAQLLFRAFGDKTARGRMRSDLSIAHPKPPRGCGIITAEQPPAVSESGGARYLSLDVKPEQINMQTLSALQEQGRQGAFAKSMAGYISFLQTHYLDDHIAFAQLLKEMLIAQRDTFRTSLSHVKFHDRIPEALSYLAVGFFFFCQYLLACDLVSEEEAECYQSYFTELLCEIGVRQSENIKQETPHEKFLSKLSTLIASGNLHFATKGGLDGARLNIAGYQDEVYYYLIFDTCHKAVKKLCEEQGEHFSATARGVIAQLAEHGYLDCSNGKRTRTLNVSGGQYVRVAFLSKEKMAQFLEGA